MATTIRTLVENTALKAGVIGEHGLAFLIETEHGAVLFDTGQGHALLHNAKKMDVNLRAVKRIVLSHGHFDHTGGLHKVLEKIGMREVFAHPDALCPKYAVRDSDVRDIGLPISRAILEMAGARFCLHEGPKDILPGITATGYIPRTTDFETIHPRFQTGSRDHLTPDEIRDDQALIVETSAGIAVVLGCAHAGLINTLLYAEKLTGSRKFTCVIGGTHLVDADERYIQHTVDALSQFDIGMMAPCHCTGFHGQVALLKAFGDRFVLNTAGREFSFNGALR